MRAIREPRRGLVLSHVCLVLHAARWFGGGWGRGARVQDTRTSRHCTIASHARAACACGLARFPFFLCLLVFLFFVVVGLVLVPGRQGGWRLAALAAGVWKRPGTEPQPFAFVIPAFVYNPPKGAVLFCPSPPPSSSCCTRTPPRSVWHFCQPAVKPTPSF